MSIQNVIIHNCININTQLHKISRQRWRAVVSFCLLNESRPNPHPSWKLKIVKSIRLGINIKKYHNVLSFNSRWKRVPLSLSHTDDLHDRHFCFICNRKEILVKCLHASQNYSSVMFWNSTIHSTQAHPCRSTAVHIVFIINWPNCKSIILDVSASLWTHGT